MFDCIISYVILVTGWGYWETKYIQVCKGYTAESELLKWLSRNMSCGSSNNSLELLDLKQQHLLQKRRRKTWGRIVLPCENIRDLIYLYSQHLLEGFSINLFILSVFTDLFIMFCKPFFFPSKLARWHYMIWLIVNN